MRRGLAVRVAVLAVLAAAVAGAGGPVAPVGAGAAEPALTVLGQSDLGGHGLDGGVSELGATGCTVNASHPSPSGVDRGVVFYDVTTPAAPKMLGRYMADQGPMDDVPTQGPGCGPPPDGNVNRCAVGQHSVSL